MEAARVPCTQDPVVAIIPTPQGGVFLKQDTVKEEQLRRWTVAFAWCMRDHLLPATRSDLQDRLVSVLTEREMQAVMVLCSSLNLHFSLLSCLSLVLLNKLDLETNIPRRTQRGGG